MKPLYLNRSKDVMLDRILGLKKDQEMNEAERSIAKKRSEIEREFMMERVFPAKEEEKESD